MRRALEMFTTFLASGAIDVDKMLYIHRRQGPYTVAFHEFVKSIMLGDRHYYKELHSPVMNLFDCGIERNSSHFTALRILQLLFEHRSESSNEGIGFFEVAKAISIFEDIFNNREDFVRCINRLISRQLVEANTRSTETVLGASHVRLTSSGWFYLKFLVSSFTYLDLILQDTPFSSKAVALDLMNSVHQVDNLSGRDEDKLSRLTARFLRVEKFLDYLTGEEKSERELYQLDSRSTPIAASWVGPIRESYVKQRESILAKINQNRERTDDQISISEEDRQFLKEFNADFDATFSPKEQLKQEQ
jgi:hypothetical protein